MVETGNMSMQCLICNEVLKTMKGDNAKQHYHRHEAHAFANLQGEIRKSCVENLKRNIRRQSSLLCGYLKSKNILTEASYRVSYRLGVAGKPFSDGELIKECITDAVKCIHPGKENDYASIPLSRDTVQRRQKHIAEQIKLSLGKKITMKDSLFSLAIDESTDITDSAQLLIFIRSISSNFDLCEDLLSMETLATHTRGEDIFLAVKEACSRANLNLKNLRGICTDGAPAMIGKYQGFVARFTNYVSKEYNNNQLVNLHCIIHQEALCTLSVDLDNVLETVHRIIVYIRANSLNHRQFRELLQNSDEEAEDILYHTNVRWLSQGETSRRVFLLRRIIVEFYSTKNKECPLNDRHFLIILAFFVDLLTYVNNLNKALQGKNTTVCWMYRKVQEFRDKCQLLKSQLAQRNYYHFPHISMLVKSKEVQEEIVPVTRFSQIFDILMENFIERFRDFQKISLELKLVASPNLVETQCAPLDLQMELVELKNNSHLLSKFEDIGNTLDAWKMAVEYPKLRELARNILVLFGSTYVCEAAFGRMKYLKNKYRTRLVNKNLETGLRLIVSSESVDFSQLSENMQEQGSH